MAKLKITIEIDSIDCDPNTALEFFQSCGEDFIADNGGFIDEGTGVSVEEKEGQEGMKQCCECMDWKHPETELDDTDRCEECLDESK